MKPLAFESSRRDAEALRRDLAALGVDARVEAGQAWTVLTEDDDALALELIDLLRGRAPRVPRSRRSSFALGGVLGATMGVALVLFGPAVAGGALEPTNDGRVAWADDDGDGRYDRGVVLREGVPSAILLDEDHDGHTDRVLRLDVAEGSVMELSD